jgi:hypothetical protein
METTIWRPPRQRGWANRGLKAFRVERVMANEDEIDGFLADPNDVQCLNLLEHEEVCSICRMDDAERDAYLFTVGSVDLAIDDVLDPAFELEARVPAVCRTDIDALNAVQAPDAERPAPANRSNERRVLDWADTLAVHPLAMCKLVKRDPVERAALRVLRQRTRPAGLVPETVAADGPARHAEWQRCLELAVLAYPLWVRPLSAWRGSAPRSLLDHVLCRYPVSDAVYQWFLEERQHQAYPHAVHASMARVWLVAEAQGVSVKNALERRGWSLSDGVIAAIPKVLSHPVRRPALDTVGLVSDAVVMQMGGSDVEWQTLAIDPGLHWSPALHTVERPRWRSSAMFPGTLQWLLRHRRSLTDQQASDVLRWAMHLDYEAWRQGAPAFSWKGRMARSAVRDANRHFEAIRQVERAKWKTWTAKGWDWQWSAPAESERLWQMTELLGTEQLVAEGSAQGHCVASYAAACAEGRTGIFQLTLCGQRQLTVEVAMASKRIVQIRGRFNQEATQQRADMVRLWASAFAIYVDAGAW